MVKAEGKAVESEGSPVNLRGKKIARRDFIQMSAGVKIVRKLIQTKYPQTRSRYVGTMHGKKIGKCAQMKCAVKIGACGRMIFAGMIGVRDLMTFVETIGLCEDQMAFVGMAMRPDDTRRDRALRPDDVRREERKGHRDEPRIDDCRKDDHEREQRSRRDQGVEGKRLREVEEEEMRKKRRRDEDDGRDRRPRNDSTTPPPMTTS
jgi:hypothetical protein